MKNYIFISLFIFQVFSIGHGQTDTTSATSQKLDLFSDSSLTYYRIDSATYFAYERPGALQHFPNSMVDIYNYSRYTVSKENFHTLTVVVASTAILWGFDQALVDEMHRVGQRIGIDGSNHLKTIGNIFGFPIKVPTDLPSSLYYIGDGWTDTAIMTSFLSYGLVADNVRSLQTASQLAEGILATTVITQILKHVTGRQSPFKATVPGGKWQFFPNQVKYHKNVPGYDAYPSGHLAAGIVTWEIIAENYKEYKFIRPVGYTLLGILCWQMLNNGVHWASDYPLAFVMGHTIARMILKRNRKVIHTNEDQSDFMNNIDLGVGIGSRNQLALILSYNF